MIRLFPLLGIQLLFILALSWGLPALYDMALVKQYATRVVEIETGTVVKDLSTEEYFAQRQEGK